MNESAVRYFDPRWTIQYYDIEKKRWVNVQTTTKSIEDAIEGYKCLIEQVEKNYQYSDTKPCYRLIETVKRIVDL